MPDKDTPAAPAPDANQLDAAAPVPSADPPSSPGDAATPPGGDDVAKGYWPEDWRERKANGDEKVLRKLQRYASPEAALDALFNAQAKISSGALKSALKPDATPEELAAWREDNGVPADPSGYQISLADGRVIGDADKPLVDEFLSRLHTKNAPPELVNETLSWYYEKQEALRLAEEQRDQEAWVSARDELRDEFGADYGRNVAAAKELIPEDIRDTLLLARTPDGTRVGADPHVVRWLVGMARELNPIGTVVPGAGRNAMQALETEISNLKAMMGDRASEYWKGPKATANQARYKELIVARDKAGR